MRTARSRSSFGNVVPRGIGSSSNLRASTIPGALHTQSLLKTSGAGQGFRRMKPASGVPLRVLFVDDMVDLNPFEGASNRTAVIVVQKGQETTYPVSYNHWSKKRSGRVPEDASLDEVLAMCRVRQLVALPVDPDDVTSSWISGRRRSLGAVRKVLGPADYQARAGASTWMNGVYWLRVEGGLPSLGQIGHEYAAGYSLLDAQPVDAVHPRARPRSRLIVSRAKHLANGPQRATPA